MFSANGVLKVHRYKNANEAIEHGWDQNGHYKDTKPLELSQAVIVQDGTVQHNPTVDLVLRDVDGNQYVAMVKASYIKSLAQLAVPNEAVSATN